MEEKRKLMNYDNMNNNRYTKNYTIGSKCTLIAHLKHENFRYYDDNRQRFFYCVLFRGEDYFYLLMSEQQ